MRDVHRPKPSDGTRVDPGTHESAVRPAQPSSVTLKKGCMWITLDHAPHDMAIKMLRTDGWQVVS